MILLVDNYDSFTYNLYQNLTALGVDVLVERNDAITEIGVEALFPDLKGIVVSPGPCTPAEAGVSVPVIQRYAGRVPILGICLGHQSVGYAFDGVVLKAPYLMHGKTSMIHHNGTGIFAGLPNPFVATRYHSLIVDRASLPKTLEITAETDDGIIMGVRHREMAVDGVQFHPESILTSAGPQLLANYLRSTAETTLTEREPALIGY
jgi:anthranilate synthase component II